MNTPSDQNLAKLTWRAAAAHDDLETKGSLLDAGELAQKLAKLPAEQRAAAIKMEKMLSSDPTTAGLAEALLVLNSHTSQ